MEKERLPDGIQEGGAPPEGLSASSGLLRGTGFLFNESGPGVDGAEPRLVMRFGEGVVIRDLDLTVDDAKKRPKFVVMKKDRAGELTVRAPNGARRRGEENVLGVDVRARKKKVPITCVTRGFANGLLENLPSCNGVPLVHMPGTAIMLESVLEGGRARNPFRDRVGGVASRPSIVHRESNRRVIRDTLSSQERRVVVSRDLKVALDDMPAVGATKRRSS